MKQELWVMYSGFKSDSIQGIISGLVDYSHWVKHNHLAKSTTPWIWVHSNAIAGFRIKYK